MQPGTRHDIAKKKIYYIICDLQNLENFSDQIASPLKEKTIQHYFTHDLQSNNKYHNFNFKIYNLIKFDIYLPLL